MRLLSAVGLSFDDDDDDEDDDDDDDDSSGFFAQANDSTRHDESNRWAARMPTA